MYDEATATHSGSVESKELKNNTAKENPIGIAPSEQMLEERHRSRLLLKVGEIADAYPDFKPDLFENKEQAINVLQEYEILYQRRDPKFSISDKTLEELKGRLERKLKTADQKNENKSGKFDNELIHKVQYQLLDKFPNKGIPYGEAVIAILSDQEVLQQAILPHLAEFGVSLPEGQVYTFTKDIPALIEQINANIAALDTMSAASPAYAAKVQAANVDVTDRAAVQSFVVESGFMEDETVSDTAKAEVAKQLGIVREVEATTGSDVDNTLDSQDPDGSPLHGEDNPISIGTGTVAYVRPDGTRVARVNVDGIGVREVPWQRGEKGEFIGLKISMLKLWAINEFKGNTDFFGETVHINTLLNQTDPEKLRQTQQVMEALLGGEAGYDGVIITDTQAEFIGWFSQYVATKGDAAEGDYNRHTAIENRTNLGFHPNGDPTQLDYDVLRAAGSFAQAQYGSGAPDYFALQEHLHELFPDRVPLTGKSSPIEYRTNQQ